MKTLRKLYLISTLLTFLFISCSEDDPPTTKEGPFKISELAGSWEATSAFFIRDSDQFGVDIIDDGGSSSISIQSSGRFTLTIDPVDRAAYTLTGEMFWEIWEGNHYFAIAWDNYSGDWDTYGATLTATTFSVYGGADTGEYDFNNDGSPESARIGFEFVRN